MLNFKKFQPAKTDVSDQVRGNSIVAALDIGSSKISCFIAEVKPGGAIEVIGIGHQASRGVRAGTIVDLRAAEAAISQTVQAAEYMASGHLQGQPLRAIFVNLPGVHTLSHQVSVGVKIAGHDVTDRDVSGALFHARGVEVPGQDELIHAIPVDFSIDGHAGIKEPRGMAGQMMSVRISAITGLTPALRNISTVVEKNLLEIEGVCAAPYASGLAALVDDERDLGCTVIDMGGGTTSMAVFLGGKLAYSGAVGVGGNHVTNDLARGLTTSLNDAERIKTLYGSAIASTSDDTDLIDVPPVGEDEHTHPNHVPRSIVVGIIQPRIEETFELVRAKLQDSGLYQQAGRRVVLTGGASMLAGLPEIGQLILDKQIRLGRPTSRIRGLAEATGGPAFSTAAGLLLYAAAHANEAPLSRGMQSFTMPFAAPGEILQKVTSWLKENW